MSGFVNLFRAEYAPEIVAVDERRYLEVATKRDDAMKAVKWIEDNYRGQAMIWTLLPNVSELLLDVQGDCIVRDISVYLESPPVLQDILLFCTSTRSWIEGEPGNVCLLLYDFEHSTVCWSSLLSCAYLTYFRLSPTSNSALQDLYSQRALFHRRSKLRMPDLPQQFLIYLRYIEHLLKPNARGHFSAITIRQVVMRGIPRCSSAPKHMPGCIPMLVIRDSRSGERFYLSQADRHYSPEEGPVRWILPNVVCFGDLMIGVHNCRGVDLDASFSEMRQEGELLFEVSLHSAMLEMHNSAPYKSATAYMHPFACCLQTPPDSVCICLDRTALGIAHKDDRFRVDFHIELILAKETREEEALRFAAAVQALEHEARQMAAEGGSAVGRAVGAQGVLKVTPNPKDLLREFGEEASGMRRGSEEEARLGSAGSLDGVNSVGVRYSFPPRKNPFSGEVEVSLLAEAGSSEGLIWLAEGQWGRGVQGVCMVLPLLVVLEPLPHDAAAQGCGAWKRCRVRVPLERLSRLACAEGRLELEWDAGDARGRQTVVVEGVGRRAAEALAAHIRANALANQQVCVCVCVRERVSERERDRICY